MIARNSSNSASEYLVFSAITFNEEAVKYDLDIVDTDYDIINAKGEVLNKCHIFTNDIHNEVVECNRRRLMTMGGSVWGKIYKRTFLLKNNLYFPENLFYEDNCFVPK